LVRQMNALQQALHKGRYFSQYFERREALSKQRQKVAATLRADDVVLCRNPAVFMVRSQIQNVQSRCSGWGSIH
ncbi:MAG: hypothetical protein ABFS37_04870, partial [Acidobacteriota bacterium]